MSKDVRRINVGGVFYTTNDVSGGPWGGGLRGTGENDKLADGDGEDEVYALGGDDRVEGGACDDEVYGGPYDDKHLEGYLGKDVLYGWCGSDLLFALDGQRDELYCGEGEDEYYADKIDYVASSCEVKKRRETQGGATD
jgi:Ca2+-binding RTX toxin-like protein